MNEIKWFWVMEKEYIFLFAKIFIDCMLQFQMFILLLYCYMQRSPNVANIFHGNDCDCRCSANPEIARTTNSRAWFPHQYSHYKLTTLDGIILSHCTWA